MKKFLNFSFCITLQLTSVKFQNENITKGIKTWTELKFQIEGKGKNSVFRDVNSY